MSFRRAPGCREVSAAQPLHQFIDTALIARRAGGLHVLEKGGMDLAYQVISVDLVEVAPDYDPTSSTSTLAAQLLMNLIGRILHAREG